MILRMKLFRFIKKKYQAIHNKVSDELKPFIRTLNYLGFTVYYSKGTLLMNMFDNRTLQYEAETCNKISDFIKWIESPVILDIGANIGLISLNLVKKNLELTVYAFEPGPHQYGLFKKTIDQNNLNERIRLFEIALSDHNGTTDFHIHNTRYAPGDGFIDTGRYGETSKVNVKTLKLDTWWNENDKPKVDAMKIDTEGAELWVLEGAEEIISECRPAIFIEMSSLNYLKYPYSAIDVFDKLTLSKYKVYSENDIMVTTENLDQLQESGVENYYCIPFI